MRGLGCIGIEHVGYATKKNLGWPWPEQTFQVPQEVLDHTRKTIDKGKRQKAE